MLVSMLVWATAICWHTMQQSHVALHGLKASMLVWLQVADFAMREELVLKVAILAEKFAPSVQVSQSTITPVVTHHSMLVYTMHRPAYSVRACMMPKL